MTPDQFWYDDIELFEAYRTAYQNKVNYQCWLNGVYTLNALETAIINCMPSAIGVAFSDNSTERPILSYYDKPIDFNRYINHETFYEQKQSVTTKEGYNDAMKNLNALAMSNKK